MKRRKPTQMEALAVLRGELEYWQSVDGDREVRAMRKAIEILEGIRAPSHPIGEQVIRRKRTILDELFGNGES